MICRASLICIIVYSLQFIAKCICGQKLLNKISLIPMYGNAFFGHNSANFDAIFDFAWDRNIRRLSSIYSLGWVFYRGCDAHRYLPILILLVRLMAKCTWPPRWCQRVWYFKTALKVIPLGVIFGSNCMFF